MGVTWGERGHGEGRDRGEGRWNWRTGEDDVFCGLCFAVQTWHLGAAVAVCAPTTPQGSVLGASLLAGLLQLPAAPCVGAKPGPQLSAPRFSVGCVAVQLEEEEGCTGLGCTARGS